MASNASSKARQRRPSVRAIETEMFDSEMPPQNVPTMSKANGKGVRRPSVQVVDRSAMFDAEVSEPGVKPGDLFGPGGSTTVSGDILFESPLHDVAEGDESPDSPTTPKNMTEEERVDRDKVLEMLEKEARSVGFTNNSENVFQTIFLLLEEPESSKPAMVISLIIMSLIAASSFSFIMETHPFVRCTYSVEHVASCGSDGILFGDSSSKENCEASEYLDPISKTILNGQFTPGIPAVGMYDACASGTTKKACEGSSDIRGFDPEYENGEVRYACRWQDDTCIFAPATGEVEECTQWTSPFYTDEKGQPVPGTVELAEQWRYWFRMLEVFAIGIFTLEYLLRMATCVFRPSKDQRVWTYATQTLNIVDLIAILPFYAEMVLGGHNSLGIMRILRLARIFRLLKNPAFVDTLTLFVRGYYQARDGLLLLFFLLFMYLCVFASILYIIEYDVQTEYCYDDGGYNTEICFANSGEKLGSTAPGCATTMDGCEDNIDHRVVLVDRFIQGPNAPGAWNGPQSDCENCHFTAYNCSSSISNPNATWQVSLVSPWDSLTGRLIGACATEVNASTDGLQCAGGLPTCGGRITELPCDPQLRSASGSSQAIPDDHPLRYGWYDNGDCLKCGDLGCGTRPFISIPITVYFICATMTTVGYGDHYPRSWPGQLVTGACMLVGVMVLAFPLIVISVGFEDAVLMKNKHDLEKKDRVDELEKLLAVDQAERLKDGKVKRGFKSDKFAAKRVARQLRILKEKTLEAESMQKFSKDSAIKYVLLLLKVLYRETGDMKYRRAERHLVMKELGLMDMH
jgi:hypothetical protein